jgi:hypothetical protein
MTNEKRLEKLLQRIRPSARVIAILHERGALPPKTLETPIAVGEGCASEIPSTPWPHKRTPKAPEGGA